MVGLCGIVGSQTGSIIELTNQLKTFEKQKESVFRDNCLEVGYVDHDIEYDEQPATVGDVSIWCWGDVLGHEYRDQYSPRPNGLSDAEYCANLFRKYGINFIAGLNSEFSGVIYSHNSESVFLFTDRLGSRPIYYTHTSDGTLVFSSILQSLSSHPGVDLDVDPGHLSEFLSYSRVFGTNSIVKDVEQVSPGSIIKFDSEGVCVRKRKYWWPNPKPQMRKSMTDIISELSEAFSKSIRERSNQNRDSGLLLSGGSDSRLVLELLEGSPIAFHMNEGINGIPEAKTAKRVAECGGAQFELLERSVDYYPDVLGSIGNVQNFNGRFDHAHAIGFRSEINSQVDSLFCGQYSDTILGGLYVPSKQEKFGWIGNIYPKQTPVSISTRQEFEKFLNEGYFGGLNGEMTFLVNNSDSPPSDINDMGDHISFSGVSYPNWTSVLEYASIYPITNVENHVFYESLLQVVPTHYPFLDNRVIDLALQIPVEKRWRDLIPRTLENMGSELASIPKPDHGLPISHPYLLKYYSRMSKKMCEKLYDIMNTTKADISHSEGPWPDHELLIREHPFIGELIEQNANRIRMASNLDYEAIQKCYNAHLDGENRTTQLYSLATLLESSINLNSG